jgi:DNA-binding response OmpR family regulator
MRLHRLLLLVESQEWGGILQLALADYEVELFAKADLARDAARRRYFDLAIVDCSRDASAATALLRDWRRQGEVFPIVVLSDLSHPRLAVELLEAGADDFLRKPYHHAELLARMRKLLARSQSNAPSPVPRSTGVPLGSEVFAFGPAVVTPHLTIRFPDGTEARLRPKQHGILKFFADRAGGIALKEELIREVWGVQGNQLSHSVNEYVSNLRRVFSDHGVDFNRLVASEPKVGWRIRAEVGAVVESAPS